MATGGIPLWDQENPDEQEPVSSSVEYSGLIKENQHTLSLIIKSDVTFWNHLRRTEVVDRFLEEDMLSLSSELDRLVMLLEYLEEECSMWQLHAFFRALVQTHQSHVVQTLGLDPNIYQDTKPTDESTEEIPEEVITLGEGYVEAYKRGCRGGTKYVCRSRAMLVGQFRAGKTNLKKSLLNESFVEEHDSTNSIEADPAHSRVDITKTRGWRVHQVEGEYEEMIAEYMLDFVDDKIKKIGSEGENEDKTSQTPVADVAKDAPDVTPQDTEEAGPGQIPAGVERALKKALKGRGGPEDKEDTVELFFWDSGGQGVFYNTHKTFLTRRSIYIIVLDLEKDLDHHLPTYRKNRHGEDVIDRGCPTKVRDYLDYWCSCVHTFMPPTSSNSKQGSRQQGKLPTIIIVCTHKDKSTPENTKRYVRDIEKFLEDKPYSNHVHPEIFTISNKDRCEKDISKLQATLVKVAQKQGYQLPLMWVHLKEKLMEHTKGPVPRATWKEAVEMGFELGMEDENDVAGALRFFHEVGDLVFFDEPTLVDFIVTKPQWLIHQFRKVITVPEFHEPFEGSRRHWRSLDEDGVLKEVLLHHLWPEDVREELITLMKRFALLIPIISEQAMRYTLEEEDEGEGGMKNVYLVPCLLPPAEEDTTGQGQELSPVPPLVLVPPHRFLPIGLTSRLIAGLMNEDGWQLAERIYKDRATFLPQGPDHSAVKIYITAKESVIEVGGMKLLGAESRADFYQGLRVMLERLDAITSSVCPLRSFKVAIQCPVCQKENKDSIISLGYRGEECKQYKYCNGHGDNLETEAYSIWFHEQAQQVSPEVTGLARRGPEFPAEQHQIRGERTTTMDIIHDPDLQWLADDFRVLRDKLTTDPRTEVVVAVLDTGIYVEHPDLRGMTLSSMNFAYRSEAEDAIGQRDMIEDSYDHGTMCTGLLKQYADKHVKLLNFKVIQKNGDGSLCFIAAALNHIKLWDEDNPKRKVDVILMSLGTDKFDRRVSRCLSELGESKVIVCAASNQGSRYPETVSFPARHPNVVSVGSCDKHGKACGHGAVGSRLDFLFPGVDIQSTSSQYRLYGESSRYATNVGTSFAAPHCAALVALVLAFIGENFGCVKRNLLTSSYHMKNLLREASGRTFTPTEGYGIPNIRRIDRALIETYIKEHACRY